MTLQDLPLPYLAFVLVSIAVFALSLTVIIGVLYEGWSDHRHGVDDESGAHIVERRRVR